MNRRPFLERPLDHLMAQREQRDAVRYASAIHDLRDRPYDWQDKVVVWACVITAVALVVILFWGR